MISIRKTPSLMLGVALACGCATRPTPHDAAAVADYRASELAAERQEFLAEADADLMQTRLAIARLEMRLQHESTLADPAKRAAWSHELFERRQEQARLEDQIRRAEEADAEEWEQMRGGFSAAIDTLQAGVTKLNDDIARAFSSSENEPHLHQHTGLCPLFVPSVDADVDLEQGNVALTLQADEEEVPDLRRRARVWASSRVYKPATPLEQRTDAVASMPFQATVQPIHDGVKLVLDPIDPAHFDTFHQAVERDAALLEDGLCATGTTQTSMRRR